MNPLPKFLTTLIIQIINLIISFFLLIISAGGDHPENFEIRAFIVLKVLFVTTIISLLLKNNIFAFLSVPLIIFFVFKLN